jgi:hypothetical protein
MKITDQVWSWKSGYKKLDCATWFRIDREVGDLGKPNSLIVDVALCLLKIADDGRLLIVITDEHRGRLRDCDYLKKRSNIQREPLD